MAKNVVEEVMDTVTVDCYIIKDGEDYFVVDNDVKSEPLKLEASGVAFVLPVNSSNRKWFNKNRVDAAIEADGKCVLTYKATRTVGSVGTRLPNEKLISFLSEEEQAEYRAIIERAIAARDAAKAKPMTEREKLEAKIAKAQAVLAKLIEKSNN